MGGPSLVPSQKTPKCNANKCISICGSAMHPWYRLLLMVSSSKHLAQGSVGSRKHCGIGSTPRLFALGVVVLLLIKLLGPHRLPTNISMRPHPEERTPLSAGPPRKHTCDCWSEMFCLKCSESGPLLAPICPDSTFAESPKIVRNRPKTCSHR